MVQLIVGEKGKGKTKQLLEKVNSEIKSISGNIVFLDKSTKHMYELNNKVRLIDVSDYFIDNPDIFAGFICGIISQDHDLEQIYCDNLLVLSKADLTNLDALLDKLEPIGEKYGVDFVFSLSAKEEDLPPKAKSKVIISL
ncbi:MAG: twitching motility protein PilT [Lachnospiraceae bacterium]|nr:twitching motility protein PilT [Lachnospiraceae bacterium]